MSLFKRVETTQVGDARVLGLDLVGGAQEGADLGDERLRELLAVELLRRGRPRRVPGSPMLLVVVRRRRRGRRRRRWILAWKR